MPRLRAVLFDLDHTLLDFDRAQRRALRGALREEGLAFSPRTLALYRRINDALWERYRRGELTQKALARERFLRLLEGLGGDARRATVLGERYLDHLSRHGEPLPGCRRALFRLRRRYRMGVVTNGIDRVQRARIEAASLRGFFETVVTSEGCGFAKPDPRILEVALHALRVGPPEAVYVGDDPAVDGAAAAAAGIPFLWMSPGGRWPAGVRRPRRRLRRLLQLPEILHV